MEEFVNEVSRVSQLSSWYLRYWPSRHSTPQLVDSCEVDVIVVQIAKAIDKRGWWSLVLSGQWSSQDSGPLRTVVLSGQWSSQDSGLLRTVVFSGQEESGPFRMLDGSEVTWIAVAYSQRTSLTPFALWMCVMLP